MGGTILLTDQYGGTVAKFPLVERPTPVLDLARWAWSGTKGVLGKLGKSVKGKAQDWKEGYSGEPDSPTLTQGEYGLEG